MATAPQVPLLPMTNCGVHLVLLKTPDFTKEAQFTLEEGHQHTSQETLILQSVFPVPGRAVQRPQASSRVPFGLTVTALSEASQGGTASRLNPTHLQDLACPKASMFPNLS